ncbi:TadE family protein [Ramlibacter aurantiacus]|uniref:TadE family protein n=1 Tax=Ramlibacter aurantiacus TaxID=2801330 RepID=UPI00338EF356
MEFALAFLLFLTFTLAVVDFSRMLFTWNAVNEATRAGARYAAVCHDGVSATTPVLARMQGMVPAIQAIDLQWQPTGCTVSTCESLTLSVSNLQYRWISPIAGIASIAPIPMPTFSTSLVREAMRRDPIAAAAAC